MQYGPRQARDDPTRRAQVTSSLGASKSQSLRCVQCGQKDENSDAAPANERGINAAPRELGIEPSIRPSLGFNNLVAKSIDCEHGAHFENAPVVTLQQ